MKPIESLERDLSELAKAKLGASHFEDFRSCVWREIRHRQAVESLSNPLFARAWEWLEISFGRLSLAAACVAAFVGVTFGLWAGPEMKDSRIAARNLDLGVFSRSASGLPSNCLASRK
ncbi:MAG: hypothetical protein WCG66_11135 [bacterium]